MSRELAGLPTAAGELVSDKLMSFNLKWERRYIEEPPAVCWTILSDRVVLIWLLSLPRFLDTLRRGWENQN